MNLVLLIFPTFVTRQHAEQQVMMDVIIIALGSRPKSGDFDVRGQDWLHESTRTKLQKLCITWGKNHAVEESEAAFFAASFLFLFPNILASQSTNLASCMTRMAWMARRWQKPAKWAIEVKRHFHRQASLALFRHGASLPWKEHHGTQWQERGSLWKDHKRALKDLELYQKTYKMSANHQVLRFKIFRKPCRLAWNGGPAVLNLNGRRDWQLGALQAPSCLEPQHRPNDPLNAETKVLSEIFTIHLYDLVSYNLM